MNEKEGNGQWAIVELMGHKVVAGFAGKDEMFGKPLLRIDIPETSEYPAFTQFYGLDAVYCITPTSEDVARITAESCKINPVSVYTPELVTVEKHRGVIADYKEQIERLRNMRALPERIEDCEEEEVLF